jgi:hypothetical protein
MTEQEIKRKFITEYLEIFKEKLKAPKIRVYAIELPLEIEGKKYADIVLINENKENFYEHQMIVLEFKKNKITYGPIDQLHMYVEDIHKRFYRKNKTLGILIAPSFSTYELKQCKSYGYHAMILDERFNMKFLC